MCAQHTTLYLRAAEALQENFTTATRAPRTGTVCIPLHHIAWHYSKLDCFGETVPDRSGNKCEENPVIIRTGLVVRNLRLRFLYTYHTYYVLPSLPLSFSSPDHRPLYGADPSASSGQSLSNNCVQLLPRLYTISANGKTMGHSTHKPTTPSQGTRQ